MNLVKNYTNDSVRKKKYQNYPFCKQFELNVKKECCKRVGQIILSIIFYSNNLNNLQIVKVFTI